MKLELKIILKMSWMCLSMLITGMLLMNAFFYYPNIFLHIIWLLITLGFFMVSTIGYIEIGKDLKLYYETRI